MSAIDDDLVIYGGDLKLPPCEKNYSQYVLNKMSANCNKIAQIDPINKKTQTYGELRINSIRCALNMKREGVKRGDVIMICGRSHFDLIVPLFGAMFIGVTVCVLHPDYSRSETLRMITLTEPKIIFCDKECTKIMMDTINEIKLECKIVTFEEDFKSYLEPHNGSEEDNFVTETVDVFNDILYIVCTSGTTGLMKGVTVTHNAFYVQQTAYKRAFEDDGPLLFYSPLSWISALNLINTAVFQSLPIIVTEYDPTGNLEIILEYEIKWLFLNPAKAYEIVNHPLFKENVSTISNNLKCLLFGGSPSSEKHVLEFHKIFKNTFIFNAYGTSEMAGFHVCFLRNKHEDILKRKIMSSGVPIAGTYMKIVDPVTGKNVGRNKEGELWIKGPTLTKGYYKDPEATSKTIDKDGWFHTGDIVIIDDENCLFVKGRCKELLKYKTWQVSPTELENIIQKHPAVESVCVISKTHDIDGDLPLAFIVKKDSGQNVTKNDIIDFVDSQVADHQKLRGGVIFLDTMPLTPSGKIKKIALELFLHNE